MHIHIGIGILRALLYFSSTCYLPPYDTTPIGGLDERKQTVCRWCHRRHPIESFNSKARIARESRATTTFAHTDHKHHYTTEATRAGSLLKTGSPLHYCYILRSISCLLNAYAYQVHDAVSQLASYSFCVARVCICVYVCVCAHSLNSICCCNHTIFRLARILYFSVATMIFDEKPFK